MAFSLSVRYLTKRRRWAVTSEDVPFVSCGGDRVMAWTSAPARVVAATACLGKKRTPHAHR